MIDEDDPTAGSSIRGTAELIDEGADEHIDALAKKYIGADSFRAANPAEQRVTVTVTPSTGPVTLPLTVLASAPRRRVTAVLADAGAGRLDRRDRRRPLPDYDVEPHRRRRLLPDSPSTANAPP